MNASSKNQAGRGFPWKLIVFLALAAAVIVIARQTGLASRLAPDEIRAAVESAGSFGPVLFMAIYAVASVLFLPGSALTLAGGALFGPFWGTVYVIVGATVGATLSFLIARSVGKAYVARLMEKKFRGLDVYYDRLEQRGFWTTMVLRLIPVFPFNGLNYALGLTPVRFRSYVAATFLGIIPGTFAYAFFGDQLATLNPWNIALGALVVAVLSIVLIASQRLTRKLGENEFDVIVIGAGSGGLNVASFMNRIGSEVLLVDRTEESIGGDCLNFGCVPSKALIHAARLAKDAREAERFGLKVDGKVDMEKVRDYVRDKQEAFRPHESAAYFRSVGMTVAIGEARFTGRDEIEVAGKRYKGRKIILATGSRPRELMIPGMEDAPLYTNETIFGVTDLPKRMVVVGGGPIGVEIAQAFRHLGSEVTIVHRGAQVLEREDEEIGKLMRARLEEDGIGLKLGMEPVGFEKGALRVALSGEGKDAEELPCDLLLVAIGRVLNLEGLGLEKAGIELDERGKLVLDKRLRTTNVRVLAVGDVAGQHQFTHAAEVHASLVIRNMLSPLKKRLDTDGMAWVTYTSPEVATFGLSEKALMDRGMSYETVETDFEEDDRGIVDDYPPGLLKLFVGKKGRILGGTMMAPNAGELVQELILAASAGLKAKDVFAHVYPYPTATRINRRAIGKYLSKGLTGRNKKILRGMFRMWN